MTDRLITASIDGTLPGATIVALVSTAGIASDPLSHRAEEASHQLAADRAFARLRRAVDALDER